MIFIHKIFKFNAVIIFITAFFLLAVITFSQDYNSLKLNNIPNNSYYKIDSVLTDTTKTLKKNIPIKFKMKKSPLTAVLLSAVLPGAGQFYNQSYWKIPIIGSLVGYFGYEYFRNNSKYLDYKQQYQNSQSVFNPNGDLNLKSLREFYRNQRNDFFWYFMIVYVVNLLDAYVDAHLFDFDVKEERYSTVLLPNKIYSFKFNFIF
jgi:TM2 domain-containing membrane protein YozV